VLHVDRLVMNERVGLQEARLREMAAQEACDFLGWVASNGTMDPNGLVSRPGAE
jgi:hypothetical protein